MNGRYPLYKGLQKPLVYRGFRGRFIYWGIGSLAGGLVIGGLVGALTNMYLGGVLTILAISAGLAYTFSMQKYGLHNKSRCRRTIIQYTRLKISYGEKGNL